MTRREVLERTIGLYSQKSVRAIGKICARITAEETEAGMEYNAEFGELTDERKAQIQRAIANGEEHGYDLHTTKHRYFFVENSMRGILRKQHLDRQEAHEFLILHRYWGQ